MRSAAAAKKHLSVVAKHSSENDEHVTPVEIVNAARRVLGAIDLDPASTELANRVIQAHEFYTKEDDGLSVPWRGRVFLNPPGGKLKNKSLPKLWWKKLAEAWRDGEVEAAIFIGFSIEIFQTTQSLNEHDDLDTPDIPLPLDFPFCVPSKRLRFLHDVDGKLEPGASPTHASVIVYLPPRTDYQALLFSQSFGLFGEVRR